MFVIDHSGLSGEKSTLEAQLNVRREIKSQFPRRPWIDVVSKGDLPITEEVRALLPEGHLLVSVKTGLNIDELRTRVNQMLRELKVFLQERENSEGSDLKGMNNDEESDGDEFEDQDTFHFDGQSSDNEGDDEDDSIRNSVEVAKEKLIDRFR